MPSVVQQKAMHRLRRAAMPTSTVCGSPRLAGRGGDDVGHAVFAGVKW